MTTVQVTTARELAAQLRAQRKAEEKAIQARAAVRVFARILQPKRKSCAKFGQMVCAFTISPPGLLR